MTAISRTDTWHVQVPVKYTAQYTNISKIQIDLPVTEKSYCWMLGDSLSISQSSTEGDPVSNMSWEEREEWLEADVVHEGIEEAPVR